MDQIIGPPRRMPEPVPKGTALDTSSARLVASMLLFLYSFAVAFWLWAKWLFSPQVFFLPPLPPVEVLVSLVEKTLGPWLVALVTLSSLGIMAIDGLKARRAARLKWWTKSLARGSTETVLVHIVVSIAGTILFFVLLALMPGAEIRGRGACDPVVHGLLLFSAFLSLIMSGPITGLVIATRSWARQRHDGFPFSKVETLNHTMTVLIVPLVVLWIVSGYPRATLDTLKHDTTMGQDDHGPGLVAAAREGDLTAVRTLLGRRVHPDAKDSLGVTPLIAAASNGHLEVVEELLRAGASPNSADSSGRTALMSAAANRYPDVVRALLKSGAPVSQKDVEGKTALILAASSGHEATVLTLLGAGADVNARSGTGETALIVAARAGNTGIVRLLLGAGGDLRLRDDAGNSALNWATRLDHPETARALRAASAKD